MTDGRDEYLALLRELTRADQGTYELGRRVHGLSMGRAGESGAGWIFYPSWLLWGPLTDWVDNKPGEAGEADAAMREAAAEFIECAGETAAERAYFDRWLYERMGYQRPESSG